MESGYNVQFFMRVILLFCAMDSGANIVLRIIMKQSIMLEKILKTPGTYSGKLVPGKSKQNKCNFQKFTIGPTCFHVQSFRNKKMILYTFCRQITLYCIALTNCGNKCFQCLFFFNPTRSAGTFNNFFATAGEKTYNDVKQRHQTNGFDVQARHDRTHPRITKKFRCGVPNPYKR